MMILCFGDILMMFDADAPESPGRKPPSRNSLRSVRAPRASKVLLATRGPKSTKMRTSHERKKQFLGRPKNEEQKQEQEQEQEQEEKLQLQNYRIRV